MKLDAMNNSFFGDDFVTGPTEAQVEETNAAGEVVNCRPTGRSHRYW